MHNAERYFIHINNTPVGAITIAEKGERLIGLSFGILMEGEYRNTPLLISAAEQLREYFAGELRAFSLPVAPEGTAFQQRVWQGLLDIPYGETLTYSQLARAIGCPNGARAVGGACGANPLPIIIPCHRVLAKGGTGGYAYGAEIKKTLLKIENSGNNY